MFIHPSIVWFFTTPTLLGHMTKLPTLATFGFTLEVALVHHVISASTLHAILGVVEEEGSFFFLFFDEPSLLA